MERNFIEVYKQILKIAPRDLAEKLEDNIGFWAPEIVWDKLEEYVSDKVFPTVNDPLSIKIYAILYGISEEDMKARIQPE
jgi:hypothetical protein